MMSTFTPITNNPGSRRDGLLLGAKGAKQIFFRLLLTFPFLLDPPELHARSSFHGSSRGEISREKRRNGTDFPVPSRPVLLQGADSPSHLLVCSGRHFRPVRPRQLSTSCPTPLLFGQFLATAKTSIPSRRIRGEKEKSRPVPFSRFPRFCSVSSRDMNGG